MGSYNYLLGTKYNYGPQDPFYPLPLTNPGGEISNNDYTLIGNGFSNRIFAAPFSSIINGSGNTINSSVQTYYGSITGLFGGTGEIYGPYLTRNSTIAGGVNNTIGQITYNSLSHHGEFAPNYYSSGGNSNSFIGAGEENKIEGGSSNNVSHNNAIIAGKQNHISRNNNGNSIIGGGIRNQIRGGGNTIIGAGTGNTITNGKYSGILAGVDNYLRADYGFIGGGQSNYIDLRSTSSSIVGGRDNEIKFINLPFPLVDPVSIYSSIVGGRGNDIIGSPYAFVGGGKDNTVAGYSDYSTIGGGKNNSTSGLHSFVGGGINNSAAGVNSIVVGGSRNQVIGGIGGYGGTGSTIVGGGNVGEYASNIIWNASYAFIGGGAGNQIQYTYVGALQSKYSDYSIILGGRSNYITDSFGSTILNSFRIMGESGRNHIINSNNSIIGGGADNFITGSTTSLDSIGTGPTITGAGINVLVNGYRNSIYDSENSFIGTGVYNRMRDASNSSIIGGADNFISGVTNVHIIGSNITGTTANTTYVERFNIGTADVDNTVGDLLVRDTDGTVKVREVTSISGATSGATVGGIPTKFSLKTGFTADVPLTITHGFGLTDTDEEFDIIVQLRDVDNNEEVGGFVDNFQSNSVDVTFSQNYANIRIVIIG
jgi:hypothetical protein